MSAAAVDDGVPEEIKVLFHACAIGRTDVVQNAIAALKVGKSEEELAEAVSTQRLEDEATPLHVAVKFGRSDVIRSLLNYGADMNVAPSKGEFQGKRPYDLSSGSTREVFHIYMFEQIAMGNNGVIDKLIDAGIPADIKDSTGDSTIHWACSFGREEVASVLLSRGCPATVVNDEGETPLHLACKNNQPSLVLLLLEEGASVEAKDTAGRTPADLLQENRSSYSELRRLLTSPPEATMKLRKKYNDALNEAGVAVANGSEAATSSDCTPVRSSSPGMVEVPVGGTASAAGTTFANADSDAESVDSDADSDLNSIFDDLDEYGIALSSTSTMRSSSRNASAAKTCSHFVFWPPVQHQSRSPRKVPMVINNKENLLICIADTDIDIFPLLTSSGLMEVMDIFGFQVQMKRQFEGAKIRLCISPAIFPHLNGYEFDVCSDCITITAADSSGLLYGVHTFIQLLQLHSEFAEKDGLISVTIPPVTVRDWPQVAQRGVMWTYRQSVCTSLVRMKEQVEYLSRLRINMMFLVIEAIVLSVVPAAAAATGGSSDDISHWREGEQKITEETTANILEIDDLAKRSCVELIPTIIISSTQQMLPVYVLKAFSSQTVCLSLLFDQKKVAAEMKASIENHSVEECLRRSCTGLLEQLLDAGCKNVILTTSEWVRAIVDVKMLATLKGLLVSEQDTRTVFPQALFAKPVVCCQDFVGSISKYVTNVAKSQSSMCIFPAFMDCDFAFPKILIKHYTLMFAGFAWNKRSLVEMLGHPAKPTFNMNLLHSVVTYLLGFNKIDISKHSLEAVMNLLLGHLAGKELFPEYYETSSAEKSTAATSTKTALSSSSAGEGRSFGGSAASAPSSLAELGQAEKCLWYLLTLQSDSLENAVPTKAQAALCLKLQRRVLTNALWKSNHFSRLRNLSSSPPRGRSRGNATASSTPAAAAAAAAAPSGGGGLFGFFFSSAPAEPAPVTVNTSEQLKSKLEAASRKADVAMDNFDAQPTLVVDVEELYSVLYMLSMLSRALVSVHNAFARKQLQESGGTAVTANVGDASESAAAGVSNVTYHTLFDALPLGTKSDIANSILETLGNCSPIWKSMFDQRLLDGLRENNILAEQKRKAAAAAAPANCTAVMGVAKRGASSSNSHGERSNLYALSVRAANKRFLLQAEPSIPAAAMFNALSAKLPLPKSVSDFIDRLLAPVPAESN